MNGLLQVFLTMHNTQVLSAYIKVRETTQDSETSFTVEVSIFITYSY